VLAAARWKPAAGREVDDRGSPERERIQIVFELRSGEPQQGRAIPAALRVAGAEARVVARHLRDTVIAQAGLTRKVRADEAGRHVEPLDKYCPIETLRISRTAHHKSSLVRVVNRTGRRVPLAGGRSQL